MTVTAALWAGPVTTGTYVEGDGLADGDPLPADTDPARFREGGGVDGTER